MILRQNLKHISIFVGLYWLSTLWCGLRLHKYWALFYRNNYMLGGIFIIRKTTFYFRHVTLHLVFTISCAFSTYFTFSYFIVTMLISFRNFYPKLFDNYNSCVLIFIQPQLFPISFSNNHERIGLTLSSWFWNIEGDKDRKSVDTSTLIDIFISQNARKIIVFNHFKTKHFSYA